MKLLRYLFLAALWALALAPTSAAQFGFDNPPVEAQLFVRVEGDVAKAVIEFEVEPGWHMYSDDKGHPDAIGKETKVKFLGTEIEWSKPRFPEPHRFDQSDLMGPGVYINGHEGTVQVYATGRIPAGGSVAGLKVEAKGQVCEEACLQFNELLTSEGAGKDGVFAAFPADLLPPGAPPASAAASASSPPVTSSPVTSSPAPSLAAAKFAGPSVGSSSGQFGFDNSPVEAQLFTRVEGDSIRAVIEFDIAPGWHMYHDDKGHPDAIGKETKVKFLGADIDWSKPLFPEPHRYDQSDVGGEGVYINGHEGTIYVYAKGRIAAGGNVDDLEVEVKGQVCDAACLQFNELLASKGSGEDSVFAAFPDGLVVTAASLDADASTESDAGAGTGAGMVGSTAATLATAVGDYPEFRVRTEATERGLAVWLLLAFLAGIILNVMPCVLPVISIKILSFVQQAGESRARIFQLGLAFGAGILVVFVALAFVAIGLGLSWGEQFQSDGFLISMIAIVFALSLSLFGVFDLGVPAGVGALSGVQREGLPDAFFKGMLATLLATPCSGPFLGSTLTWTLGQPSSTVLLIFVTLGLGMAFPYVVLTANPAFLKIVPKPGAWMDTFKNAMGFLLLGTVVYLMISVRQDNLLFTVSFLVFVAFGCWWWGHFAKLGQSRSKRLSHLAIALGICVLGARIAFVDFRGLFQGGSDHVAWVDFEQEEFVELLGNGRSVFVDFTADWCPNCKYNETFVFNSEPVRNLLERKGVVSLQADMTDDAPAIEALLKSLGGRSIPFMAVFPGDDPYAPYVLPDVVTVAEVSELLEACPDPSVAAPPPNH